MKKLLLLALLVVFSCEGTADSEESYELADIVGTWQLLSSSMDMSMDMNMAVILSESLTSEDDCSAMGGNYVNGHCNLNSSLIDEIASLACSQYDGTYSSNICSITQAMEVCCSDSEISTYTIDEYGNITLTSIDEDGEQVITGTILINERSITMTLSDQPSMTGLISLVGNTMTLSFSLGNEIFEAMEMDFEEFESFASAISNISVLMIMVMER